MANLQLLEGETAASPRAAVVFDGRASHNRTELVDWARSNSSGLGQTGLTTAVLASGLYELGQPTGPSNDRENSFNSSKNSLPSR